MPSKTVFSRPRAASASGSLPLPTTTLADPTRESSPQAAARAWSTGHVGTEPRRPASPGGSETVERSSRTWPSGRSMRTVSAVSAPAVASDEERPSDGVNAGGEQPTTSAASLGEAAAPPLKGVMVATAA